MFVSTREMFSEDNPTWVRYIESQGSADYTQVRSIDLGLNPIAQGAWNVEVSPGTLASSANSLPKPRQAEYQLLAINLDKDESCTPVGWTLLGHDLADETQTSSLLNCGPWKGSLEQLIKRQNRFGLLTRPDAELAQKLLPSEWGAGEPHSHVMIWALYERQWS